MNIDYPGRFAGYEGAFSRRFAYGGDWPTAERRDGSLSVQTPTGVDPVEDSLDAPDGPVLARREDWRLPVREWVRAAIGDWMQAHFQHQAHIAGVGAVARRLRKQGVPLTVALYIIFGR